MFWFVPRGWGEDNPPFFQSDRYRSDLYPHLPTFLPPDNLSAWTWKEWPAKKKPSQRSLYSSIMHSYHIAPMNKEGGRNEVLHPVKKPNRRKRYFHNEHMQFTSKNIFFTPPLHLSSNASYKRWIDWILHPFSSPPARLRQYAADNRKQNG